MPDGVVDQVGGQLLDQQRVAVEDDGLNVGMDVQAQAADRGAGGGQGGGGARRAGPGQPASEGAADLRRRIGIAPVKKLFETLAGPLGQPRTPGIMFGGYRTVSFDGCKAIKVVDGHG